jgi:hypothetical protein
MGKFWEKDTESIKFMRGRLFIAEAKVKDLERENKRLKDIIDELNRKQIRQQGLEMALSIQRDEIIKLKREKKLLRKQISS